MAFFIVLLFLIALERRVFLRFYAMKMRKFLHKFSHWLRKPLRLEFCDRSWSWHVKIVIAIDEFTGMLVVALFIGTLFLYFGFRYLFSPWKRWHLLAPYRFFWQRFFVWSAVCDSRFFWNIVRLFVVSASNKRAALRLFVAVRFFKGEFLLGSFPGKIFNGRFTSHLIVGLLRRNFLFFLNLTFFQNHNVSTRADINQVFVWILQRRR